MAAEAPVWALLDRLGVPFRQSVGPLVASYGTEKCVWWDELFYCHLPGQRILPAASAFSFRVWPGLDATLPPPDFSADLRGARWQLSDMVINRRAERNFDDALQGLVPLLGPGEEGSVSNTRARIWQFGRARVELMCFPPRLNRTFGKNTRHIRDPGSEHEATLRISPMWMPDLTEAELNWLRDFRVLGQLSPPRHAALDTRTRWQSLPAGQWQSGYGISRDLAAFCTVSGQYAIIIPRATLLSVALDIATPAKGTGGADVSISYAPVGHDPRHEFRFTVATAPYAPNPLEDVASALATALDLPLDKSVFPDC